MLGRMIAMGTLIAIGSLIGYLLATKPSDAGPLGILFVFVLIYMSALGTLTLLMVGVGKIISKMSVLFVVVNKPITLRFSYYYSLVVALVPVMLIGMQSVDEVGFYDVILISIFVVVACVYISKRIR